VVSRRFVGKDEAGRCSPTCSGQAWRRIAPQRSAQSRGDLTPIQVRELPELACQSYMATELYPPFREVSSMAPHTSSSGRGIERCVRRPFKDEDAELRRYD
jgi:hypothetical protein